MRVIIRANPEEVAKWVAIYVKARILQFKPTPTKPFVLGLPTGSSPLGVYQFLVKMYERGEISFQNVITFNMDEYVGLPRDHPQSYHSFMWSNLFKYIDIKPENVHILDGNAKDLQMECKLYEEKIRAVGGIELFLGGVGIDGHIAFNEPGSSLVSVTRVKTLAYETVVANARFFDGDIKKVPKSALTVGVKTIMEAHEVLIIISGQHKAHALMKCIEEGVNHMYTMSALQLHQNSVIVCDEDATLELRVRTVRYFKGLETVHMTMLGDLAKDVLREAEGEYTKGQEESKQKALDSTEVPVDSNHDGSSTSSTTEKEKLTHKRKLDDDSDSNTSKKSK